MIILKTDGGEESFYTAVAKAYSRTDYKISSEKEIQTDLFSSVEEVTADTVQAEEFKKKLQELDGYATQEIEIALRSGDRQKEQTALEYIRLIFEKGKPVREMSALQGVMDMDDLVRRVLNELHKMKGFLRFTETSDGVLYAPFSPDNDIIDLLAEHFTRRLKNQKFVIHDIARKTAVAYDGKRAVLFNADRAEINLSDCEKSCVNLWRLYYRSVNIESRPHEKQMKGYMPVRYWKFLPEKK